MNAALPDQLMLTTKSLVVLLLLDAISLKGTSGVGTAKRMKPMQNTLNFIVSLKFIKQASLSDRSYPASAAKESHDSRQFLHAVRNAVLSPDNYVKDPFTSILLQHVCELLLELLRKDATLRKRMKHISVGIIDLTNFCTTEDNHFQSRGKFFPQKNGAPMDSSLSPAVAEPFKEDLEKSLLSKRPTFLHRYVSGIFTVIQKGSEQLFLDLLSNLPPTKNLLAIKIEQTGLLFFQNALLVQKRTSTSTQVYGETINTDRTNYMSNHLLCVKRGLMIGEHRYIETILRRKGYPTELINTTSAQKLQRFNRPDDAARHTDQNRSTPMPYCEDIGDRIRSLSGKLDFVVRLSRSPTYGA
ncbi:hypothetical protein M514_00053 [Trichuris suis]|uniref:Uncharacterized protein n=1 Tax=Trichuris suis TaxID=68888 RepID=A0A085MNU4_9BILA|nr:hypothetical protein M513_00053 [Trichuris suis]KFD72915.1 hypothetical protein M514_00053 [Trichuris suis]